MAEKNSFTRDFLSCINKRIEDLNLKIVKAFDEESARKVSYLVLVNKSDRSMEASKLTMKAMVTFAPHEVEYLKILIAHIMESDMREITQTYALNRITEIKTRKVTQQEAEKLLKKFCDKQWLRFSSDSPKVRLSTRCIFELEPYLRDVYKDQISNCGACNKLVVRSIDCPNEDCDSAYHMYCVQSMADSAHSEPKCKKCKHVLPRRRAASNFPNRRARNPEDDDDDDDDDEEEDDRRPKAGTKRKNRVISGLASESDSD